MKLINYISCHFLLFSICSDTIATESVPYNLGLGINHGHNFDGDLYKNAQSIHLIYKKERIQFNVGAKHLYQLNNQSKYLSDLSFLYSLHHSEHFDFKIGIGLEDRSPNIEYIVEYGLSDQIELSVSLNQILSDDFDQNQREAVVGINYYFYKFTYEPETEIQARPTTTKIEKDKSCQGEIVEYNCNITIKSKNINKENTFIKSKTKPKLPEPYTVKKGDWLHKLQRIYDFNLEEIIERNNIKNPDRIFAGQILE